MATLDVDIHSLSPPEHRAHFRRTVIASIMETAIESCDFFLCSIVTGLVFANLLFPHADLWMATLETFAIYAVGFVALPSRAAIFAHCKDRIRRSTLIATLLLMGLAAFAVALVPKFETIGIWSAVIATALAMGIGSRFVNRLLSMFLFVSPEFLARGEGGVRWLSRHASPAHFADNPKPVDEAIRSPRAAYPTKGKDRERYRRWT